ncbi:MAG: PCRF domain-containing protein, partial [Deltaproteobacteria bacterium]|nr:PCRF domain-containing protein [Deltaproteobacteria bacterium]
MIFDLTAKENRLQEIETIIAKENFWDNPDDTKTILRERALLSEKVETFKQLAADIEENDLLFDLAIEESDADTLDEATRQTQSLEVRIKKLSFDLMLDDADDPNNAIISINAGAGGTDA